MMRQLIEPEELQRQTMRTTGCIFKEFSKKSQFILHLFKIVGLVRKKKSSPSVLQGMNLWFQLIM